MSEVHLDGVVLTADVDADPSMGGVGTAGKTRQHEAEVGEPVTQPDRGESEIGGYQGKEGAWLVGEGGVDVGGELGLALNLLPQRMADLEDLAREGLDYEVMSTCCSG